MVDPADGVMRTPAWTEPVACPFESSLPARLKGVLDHALKGTISNRWDSERVRAIAVRFVVVVYPIGWSAPPRLYDSQ